MVFKKINAVIALLAALTLATHTSINARMMMLGRVYDSPVSLAYILMSLVGLHVVISICMLIKHEGKTAKYSGLYKGTMWQRISAIAVIPLVLFHAFIRVGTLGFGLIAILVVHFFVMILAFSHIAISVPNALVTLGVIDTTSKHKKVRTVCIVISILLFILGLSASISEVIAL